MRRSAYLSHTMYKKIMARQPSDQVRFLEHYRPGKKATREEASRTARAATIRYEKFKRDIHLHSTSELDTAPLALYHPRLIDFHEQHRLHRYYAEHPLAGRSDTAGLTLMPFQGTTFVAERLGMLHRHPRIYVKPKNDDDDDDVEETEKFDPKCEEIIFPYLGDFLLILQGESYPYCVNWDVKPTAAAFVDPNFYRTKRSLSRLRGQMEALQYRHDLEREYFRDAGIRTVRIVSDRIDRNVIKNLKGFILRASDPRPFDPDKTAAIEKRFNDMVREERTLYMELGALASHFGCKREECKTVFDQGVWNRTIRVDLFQSVLTDQPLRRESDDVIRRYADWFRGY